LKRVHNRAERFRFVFGSTDGYGVSRNCLILGWVRLGWKYSRKDLFRFRFYCSYCIYRRRMRTYLHTAIAVVDRYDIFSGGHKSVAGVGSGRRRRLLIWYGFCFSIRLWNMFVIIPVLNKAPGKEDVLGEWMHVSTHSLSSALDGGECSASRPGCFPLWKEVPEPIR
jgi:hypothetical protein